MPTAAALHLYGYAIRALVFFVACVYVRAYVCEREEGQSWRREGRGVSCCIWSAHPHINDKDQDCKARQRKRGELHVGAPQHR